MRVSNVGFSAVAALTIIFALLGERSSQAQKADRPVRMQITGTVTEIGGLTPLTVSTDKDEKWKLGFSQSIVQNEDVHIRGNADIAWVQPGFVVRMSAKINPKKGVFLEPVSNFEVITLRPEIEYGIHNEDKPFEGTFESKTVEKKTQKSPEEITATIVGEIASIKSGKISVKVPGSKTLKGELAEKCKVTVDVDMPQLIRVGDKVTIEGTHYEYQKPDGGAAGIGAIDKIEVDAAAKFELMKPTKKGARPYDNAKPGDNKSGDDPKAKPEEKGAAKPASAKPEASKPAKPGEKPAAEPKKKP
jgi:hypothetical protein